MKYSFITIFFFCLLKNAFTQTDPPIQLRSIADKAIENIINADKQRAFLVTDRKIYAAGETIYFKAYLVDSIHNFLRSTPVKLYVDFVDENDSVIKNIVLNNTNFQTDGRFVLPDSLHQGFYWMRAYTKEMITNNIGNIGVTAFYVVTKNQALKQQLTNVEISNAINKPVLKFYPEGGAIISGVNSTIAVSSKDNYGNPQYASGIIKDNKNDTVSSFITNQYGLAKFAYFPKWFNRYSVFIKNANQYDSICTLPKINFYAAQLSVTQQTNDYITLQVALEDSIYTKNYTTYILGINRDSVCFSSVGKGMYKAQVPVGKLPGGIQTFYLFNTDKQLLSSRSIYINKENYHLKVNADKKKYAARSAVKLDLHLTDANDKPLVAALSLSVIDKDAAINTSPLYQDDDTLQYLSATDADLIMLTQATANPLSLTASNSNHDEDSGFVLTGTVLNAKNQPVEKCAVTILSSQHSFILYTDTSDVNGKFKFDLPGFYDSTQFTIQLTNVKGKFLNDNHVVFDTESKIRFLTPVNLKKTFTLNDSLQLIKSQLLKSDSALSFANGHWLKPVTVKGYKKPQVNYDESKRVSHNSQIFTRDMLGEGANMTKIILLNNPNVRRLFFGPPSIAGDPLIVLDGVEIPGGQLIGKPQAKGQEVAANPEAIWDFINSIPVSTIDFIEVLAGPEAAAYGMEGGHGVILINTRSGAENLPAGVALKSFYTKGFYNNKPFEMPDYSKPQILKSKLPDFRKTIYWNGNIVTNKNGEATVEFFSADLPATYIGTISGVTSTGQKIYQTFTVSRN